jgi:hypothetical protein
MDITEFYPNEDPKVIYLFEIIGSYFTDVIFNHIYNNAKLKLEKNKSLVDEYIKKLQLYVIGIKSNVKCYDTVIKGLHKYYLNITSTASSLEIFNNIIIEACIPDTFANQISNTGKDEIVSNILCELASNLIVYASSAALIHQIINTHSEKATEVIRQLQDFSIQILVTKKISILNKFLKETGQISNSQFNEMINNLKDIIKKLAMEKNELIAINKELELRCDEYKEKEEKMNKLISLLNSQLKVLNHNFYSNKPMQNNETEIVPSPVPSPVSASVPPSVSASVINHKVRLPVINNFTTVDISKIKEEEGDDNEDKNDDDDNEDTEDNDDNEKE